MNIRKWLEDRRRKELEGLEKRLNNLKSAEALLRGHTRPNNYIYLSEVRERIDHYGKRRMELRKQLRLPEEGID